MLKCQRRSHVSDCMEEKLLLCLRADFASLFVKRCPWRSDGFVFTVLPEAGSRFFYGFLSIIFSSVCVKRRLWDWLGNRLPIIHWDWYQVNFNSKEKKAFEHSDRPNCLDVASGFWLSCLNSDLCCLITKLIKDTFRLKVGNWTTFRPIALPVKSVAKSFYPWIAELQSGSRAS